MEGVDVRVNLDKPNPNQIKLMQELLSYLIYRI